MAGGIGEEEFFVYLESGVVNRSIFRGCGRGGNGEGYFDCKGGLGSAGLRWMAALELYSDFSHCSISLDYIRNKSIYQRE